MKKYIHLLISWRLLLFVFSLIGFLTLPFKDSFPYRDSVLIQYGHPLFYSWANFDGVHYLGIAKSGYFADFTQAFFPVYPLAIRWLDMFIDNYLLSGLILSHTFLVLSVFVFIKLARLDYDQKHTQESLLYLLLFPTAFYLVSLYTESLFLFLTLSSFYFIRTKQPIKAILSASIATATRFIGIFLIPALMYERFTQLSSKHQQKPWYHLAPFIIPASGLLTYMRYLQIHHSDALYFLHAQPAFGASRSTDKLILLYQVIYRYIKMTLTVNPQSLLFYTVLQEFGLSMLFIWLIYLVYKHTRPSYAIFSALAYLAPTLTGTFSSMPRYVLILFPCFFVLPRVTNPTTKKILLVISAILLAVNTILFTRGYWVA